jgi:hypothetical protein
MIEGENLTPIAGYVVSGEGGVLATNGVVKTQDLLLDVSGGGIVPVEVGGKGIRVGVSVAADAPFGARELRLVSPMGVSTPAILNVGFLPEIQERLPNNSTNDAQTVELPTAINGRIDEAAGSDFYRFHARKGDQLSFEVIAFRSGSALDSSLAILNPSGKELARSEDSNGLDSLIDFTVPDDGDYLLQIRDFRFQGGRDFKYRIVAGALPYVDSVFPLGGQRGQPIELSLRGRHLEEAAKLNLRIEPDAATGQREVRVHNRLGYSNPVRFAIGELAEFTESEPNNNLTNANRVKAPVTINGQIGAEKDADFFVFAAEKGQTSIIELIASRFGSPLDGVLTLTDKSGKTIQENDDAAGADARIEQAFPEAGEYVVKVRDLLNRGGEDFGYRLAIRPPKPDFTVTFSPDTPRISRGRYTNVTIDVQRQGGFGGPVEINVQDLPDGVTAGPLILAGEPGSSPMLVLHAADDASIGYHRLKVVGAGMIGEARVVRDGKPQSEGRTVRESFLTVLDRPAFTLKPVTVTARMDQGQSAPVECLVVRQSGFTSEIQVSLEGFSTGREALARNFDVESVTVKAGESRARLSPKAKSDSETGTRSIVFKGESKIDGQSFIQYSRAIPLTVDAVPFTLVSSLPRLAVTASPPEKKSPASEAEFSIKASRRGWFDENIALAVEGLPEGISASTTNIARGPVRLASNCPRRTRRPQARKCRSWSWAAPR